MKKTFILCLGAQKSGTTWLHKQLSSNNVFNFGKVKEYDVLNNLNNVKMQDSAFILENSPAKLGSIESKDELIKYMRNNINNYANYFEYLSAVPSDTIFTGDFSPNYWNITSERIRLTKKLLESRGFHVKVIFLMRDPVERLWSQVRMLMNSENRPLISGFLDENQAILYTLSQSYAESRSKYKSTIENIEDNFDSSDIFYGFFEKIFNHDEYSKLASFLGYKLLQPDSDKKVFPSPKINQINEHTKIALAAYYKETYAYCLNKFDREPLQIWSGYKLLSQAIESGLMISWKGKHKQSF